MRIRASQIVVGILLLVGASVLVVLFSSDTPTRAATSDPAPGGAIPPAGQPDQVAVIELETQEFVMGTIAHDAVAEKPLKVRNRGRIPLTITEIKTSCGCTQGSIAPEHASIPPGGEATITVAVDPRRIPGFHAKKTLTIFSNDIKNPTVAVTVETFVDPEFEVPEKLSFGDVPKGEARSASITFRQLDNEPLELTSAETYVPEGQPAPTDISYAITRLPESEWKAPGKAEYTLTATLDPSIAPGAFRHTCVVKTNVARLPLYRFTVEGNVVSFYHISPAMPERVMLRPKEPNGLEMGTATITSDKPLEVSDLQFDASKLSAVVRPGENPNTVYIDVTAAPEAPRGRLDEEIKFSVQSGTEKYTDRIGARAYITRVAPPASS